MNRPRSLNNTVGFAVLTTLLILLLVISTNVAAAKLLFNVFDLPVSRGEAVHTVIESFNLRHKERSFLTACYSHLDDCSFVFSAMSDFDGITLEPLILYPDVNQNFRYYDSINFASMLGLVHGYLTEDQTPFRPEAAMTRIQALKVVLGAVDLIKWKEKFELDEIEETDFEDVHEWWHSRYVNFAIDAGVISEGRYFRPNEPITEAELMGIIENVKEVIARRNQAAKTVAGGS